MGVSFDDNERLYLEQVRKPSDRKIGNGNGAYDPC